MGASKYNRLIGLQTPIRANNGQGGSVKSWSASTPLWAEMIPLRGQEAVVHNLATSGQLWKVTIRFRAGVTTDCRLMFGTVSLNIRSCQDPDGRRRELVMTCESGVKT